MKLSQVVQKLDAKFRGKDRDFKYISIDTRTMKPGSLFIALKGPRFDAHDFIQLALERGAVGAIVSRWVTVPLSQIFVNNTHTALMQLANYQRNKVKKTTIVAVTGSCGKTTTKVLISNILSQKGNVLTSDGNFNNSIGLSITLLNLHTKHKYAVVELGASRPEEISRLARITKPNIAIVTNAGLAHLEGFNNIEGVAKAKGEIYQELSLNQIAIVNNDDPFANFWKKIISTRRIITFSCNDKADVTAKNISVNFKGYPNFRLILPNGETDIIQLSLLGRHNITNALAAAAVACVENFSITTIKFGLENTIAVNRRLVSLKGYRGATIIDDSYNANPLSVSSAIDVLSTFHKCRLILVLGDMQELGDEKNRLHCYVGKKAFQSGVHELFCYGLLTRYAAKTFGDHAYYFNDQKALLTVLKDHLDKNTVVLVKGSFSMNMGKIVDELIGK
ncbi:UDP-N-acetylmuramoyl-tripeptide--D-alanyl-D-alanine ligase [Coxiella endosymbiont of Amblyomma americanum]|uniref:UDP-N-acetylmuramoyl-tripeptide--D-alanyl-D- alanine ligase n=1 Tax=Coxiella endosymbiont of Amblyomma americanum TaxID=325775 RepID=UPI00057DA951|nr:UDP-N-acetylmuramoyl-tripeptide--D-alanyl-D-alanine ligase [Coxiella endosymbiont of Amblyomma americanum]AJC50390.1 UDP-N-acetylmuramoyl-tripeptide--D-alanyl-D-alanine ligase [Coxiella endosymbiont of Amblyomma americanum]AUJ58731.1 UDP-N-acetylmuramoyl-tripeptide--D-alanyl-D-alanine ligase [Coxiella-like endosymbiont of Amblyomma americanum]